MQIVVNLPDLYIRRWYDLMDKMDVLNMEQFLVYAIGIGIQTIDAATRVLNTDEEAKVIPFKEDYYWSKDIGAK